MQFPSGDHPWPTVAEKGTLRNVGGCRVEWKQGMIRNVRPDREIHHMSAPPFIRPSTPPLLRILEAITFSACFVSSSSSSLLSLANYYRHKRVPFFFFFPQVFGTIVVIFSWFLFLDWTTRIIRWNLFYQSFKSDDTRLIQSTSRPTNLFRGATNTLLKGQRDYKPSNPGKSENPRPFERGPPCFLNINEPWNVVSSSLSFFSTWEKQIGRGVSSSRYSRPLALTVEWLSSVSSFKLGPLPPVHLTSSSPLLSLCCSLIHGRVYRLPPALLPALCPSACSLPWHLWLWTSAAAICGRPASKIWMGAFDAAASAFIRRWPSSTASR